MAGKKSKIILSTIGIITLLIAIVYYAIFIYPTSHHRNIQNENSVVVTTDQLDTPNQKTIQIGEKQHIHLQPEILQYTNHNCDPNVYFNTTEMQLECIRDIGIDDEITFFYPSTEWNMAEPFECQCGATSCLRIIKGAKDMDKKVLSQYKLSKYINESISL